MNIAIFTNNYIPFSGGVPTSIRTFKKAAEQKGHKVLIFCPSYPGYKDREKNIFRIPSLEIPTYNNYRIPLPFLGKIENKIKNIDIIHVHHPYLLGKKGLKIAKKKNIPIIFTHHTLYEKYLHYIPLAGRIIQNWTKKMIKKFCTRCDLIIAPSEYVEKLLEKRDIKTKIKIIPTGINLDKYKKTQRNIRNKYHLSKNAEILLYAGRITEEKNLFFLLKA
ncbi:glycosyltransferase, partial [Candidatus Peregrinibacteria bacterium]|nr:glycosyltransferase [Candidatus Peregrinibacteria bacterium]